MNKNNYSNSFELFLSGEVPIFRTNPHWIFLAIPLSGISFFFLSYLFFICPFLAEVIPSTGLICYITTWLILLFFSFILCLEWKHNRLILTNFRLTQERGIFGNRRMSIRLDNIQDITSDISLASRLFDYGTLIIESAGKEGKMVFQGMPSPDAIKRMIEGEVQRFTSSRPFPST